MDENRRRDIIKGAYGLIISVILVPSILAYFHMSTPVVILGAACSLVALATWENWPFIRPRSWSIAALIMIGVFIWADYLYYLNIPTNGWYWHFKVSFPREDTNSTSPQSSTKSSQDSKTPWVTEGEIYKARSVGRLLIPYSPEEISYINYSQGGDGTAVYAEKWVKIGNRFSGVRQLKETDNKDYLVVSVEGTFPMRLIFDQKQWEDKILLLRTGDIINGFCQLAKFNGKPFDLSESLFVGLNCELN
jgi:hypothetical protein